MLCVTLRRHKSEQNKSRSVTNSTTHTHTATATHEYRFGFIAARDSMFRSLVSFSHMHSIGVRNISERIKTPRMCIVCGRIVTKCICASIGPQNSIAHIYMECINYSKWINKWRATSVENSKLYIRYAEIACKCICGGKIPTKLKTFFRIFILEKSHAFGSQWVSQSSARWFARSLRLHARPIEKRTGELTETVHESVKWKKVKIR